MADKRQTSDHDISLFHENKHLNNPMKVFKIFNDYFIKAASNTENEVSIRDDEIIDAILCTYQGSELIQRIASNVLHDGIFKFSFAFVKGNDLLNKTDPTNATGYDDKPPKLLKMEATQLTPL